MSQKTSRGTRFFEWKMENSVSNSSIFDKIINENHTQNIIVKSHTNMDDGSIYKER